MDRCSDKPLTDRAPRPHPAFVESRHRVVIPRFAL